MSKVYNKSTPFDLDNYKDYTSESLLLFLEECSNLYYTGEESPVSDIQWDEIEEYLYSLVDTATKTEYLKKLHFGTSNKLSSGTGWVEGTHKIPMGSLDKISPNSAHTKESFFGRINNEEIIIQEKLDGISLSLEYENGELVSAKMRNDGVTGDDIYSNAKQFIGVPNKVEYTKPFSVRGEVVITKDDFEELGKISNNKYTALRNAAAGIAREYKGTYAKYLSFIAYDMAEDNVEYKQESYKIEQLTILGFNTVKTIVGVKSITQLDAIEQNYIESARANLPYLIDGLVLKQQDLSEVTHSAGNTVNPLHQIALKFPAEKAVVRVTDIVWQVGKNGRYTPVLEFEPTRICGAMIGRATLHNIVQFKKAGIKKDDLVIISRSGDVIPYFEGVHATNDDKELFTAPSACTECNHNLEQVGSYLECVNPTCGSKVYGKICNWFDKLDYDGLAGAFIGKIFDSGIAKTIAEFYMLEPANLRRIGFGDQQAINITNIVDSKDAIPLAKVLGCLNINNFSVSNSTKLVNGLRIDSIDKLENITGDEIMKLEGFGATSFDIANALRAEVATLNEIIEVFPSLIDFDLPKVESEALKGKSFCFTGSFKKSRDEMVLLVKKQSGDVKSGVTTKLDYLVNDDGVQKGKYAKALTLGVPIITSNQLLEMAGLETL